MKIEPSHLALLGHALASERGVIILTSNPERLRTKLYAAKKTQPEFSVLKFEVSRTEPESHLWIVKSSTTEQADGE